MYRRSSLALLLFLSLSVNQHAQDPGFFLDNWKGREFEAPLHVPAEKSANAPGVTVYIHPDSVINLIPPYIFGNNAVTWGGGFDNNVTARADLANLAPNVLRWPGGSLSNEYFWNMSPGHPPTDVPAEIGPWAGMNTASWQMSLDEYYAMREEAGCAGVITLNYGYARYGTSQDPVAAAAHLAADWVRYDNGRTRFWEIGNENYGNWEKGNIIDTDLNQDGQPVKISGQLYGEHCRVFIDSLRKAASEVGNDIKIGVVAYDAETSWDPVSEVWNEGMMPEVGHLADFIIVHNYFTPHNQDSPVETILNSHPDTKRIMDLIESDMLEAGQEMIPVAMTEYNIFAVGSKQQVSDIAGMHAALVVGDLITEGYGMANRWDLLNGWNDGNDHGLFSTGGEPGVDPYNPRPAFFYLYYWQKYMGDRLIYSTVEGSNEVIAYASSYSSGDMGLVLVNKGRSARTVGIEPGLFEPGTYYYSMTLTGDADRDFSRKVYLNGQGGDEAGGGPDDYEDVPARAMLNEGSTVIELPALGTAYIIIEKQRLCHLGSTIEADPGIIDTRTSMPVDTVEHPAGFTVTVNGTQNIVIDSVIVDASDQSLLHIHLGTEVLASDVLELSYAGNGVRNAAGEALCPFGPVAVNNLLPGSPPVVQRAYTQSDGGQIYLKCSKDLILGEAGAGDFTLVQPPDVALLPEISGLALDDGDASMLVLEVSRNIVAEDVLVLDYSGDKIGSGDGGLLQAFSGLEVENLAPGLPPEVKSAAVNDDGTAIILIFSKDMQDLSSLADDFSLEVDGSALSIVRIDSEDSRALLYPAVEIEAGQVLLLSYSGDGAASMDRGLLAAFNALEVENNLEAPVVHSIPGIIDLELFAFNRGMQLEDCSDEGGGQNLAHIEMGDYVDYTIDVQQGGAYTGLLRVAASESKGFLDILTPESDKRTRQRVSIPVTGGWQEWTSVPVAFELEAGEQMLRLYAATRGFNLNWLQLELDTLSSLEGLRAGAINIYPNPVNDILNIQLKGMENEKTFLILSDIQGRSIMEQELQGGANQLAISMLDPGIYLLVIHSGKGRMIRRLVKH